MTTWVWEHSASRGPARLVLLAIADNAHDDGAQAWPSITTLVRKTGHGERTVQEALQTLQAIGELAIDYNKGPGRCNLYRVLMADPAGAAPPQEPHPARTAGVQEPHPTPAGAAPSPPQEPHPEPSLEPSRNRIPPSAAANPATVAVIPTAQTLVAAYVDAYRGRAGHDPPSRVKGQLARELSRLIGDGLPTDAIKAGLVAWFERDQHPSTLASFVEVEARGGTPRTRPTRAQQQRDQMTETHHALQAWAEGGDSNGQDPMGRHRRPAQRELPRSGATP